MSKLGFRQKQKNWRAAYYSPVHRVLGYTGMWTSIFSQATLLYKQFLNLNSIKWQKLQRFHIQTITWSKAWGIEIQGELGEAYNLSIRQP